MTRAVVTLMLCLVALFAYADGESPPFAEADFVVLYPEVRQHPAFKTWSLEHLFGRWRELKPPGNGREIVIVQERGDVRSGPVFAAELQNFGTSRVVSRFRSFTTAEVSTAFDSALPPANLTLTAARRVARPVVTFDPAPSLRWDMTSVTAAPSPSVAPPPCATGDGDALSEDELHHPAAVKTFIVSAGVTNGDDAHMCVEKLCARISDKNIIPYDSFGGADVFTDADTLVLRRGGVCDEKAILLTSCLRALGIPARMKFLSWKMNNNPYGHACVEYIVNGVAYHADPTFNKTCQPEYYRTSMSPSDVITDVRVLDVDWPFDPKSSSDIDGFADPDGDGRLNQWFDFCYVPTDKKGDKRPGYTHD